MALLIIATALLLGSVNSENSTILQDVRMSDSCESDFGPWSRALEDWATATQSDRQGRIMLLPPPTKGYYVTERIDTPYLSPPPPPPGLGPGHLSQQSGHTSPQSGHTSSQTGHMPPQSGHYSPQHGHMPQQQQHMLHKQGLLPQYYEAPPTTHAPAGHKEWEASPPPGVGKIVNRPPSPYKDKYKPNYPSKPSAADRVDEPPGKRVSETDLYLLGAIEKLVYRVDRMEKRLRKVEDGVHYALAGGAAHQEPCPGNFTRVGAACYSWAGDALDWKSAALACRALRAALLELPDRAQRAALEARLRAGPDTAGSDFWTGGLNPGLLWIWSHSAKPVEGEAGGNSTIAGEGRCLALRWQPQRGAYELRGADCAARLRYACALSGDEGVANEIQRVARALRAAGRLLPAP